jgi:hypothetical protein
MTKKYEIHSGRRLVSTVFSVSADQAALDYVRSRGINSTRSEGSDSTLSPGAALTSRPFLLLQDPSPASRSAIRVRRKPPLLDPEVARSSAVSSLSRARPVRAGGSAHIAHTRGLNRSGRRRR